MRGLRGSFRLAFPAALAATAAVLLFAEPAHALTTLRQVQVSNGQDVSLLFDRDVDRKSVKTEYFRDIIQVSIRNVSVYPAKILSVESDDLTKVFAYQYTPKQVRCRLTVKGKAEDYRGRIKIDTGGKVLKISIDGKPVAPVKAAVADELQTSRASAVRESRAEKVTAKEREILQRVIQAWEDRQSTKTGSLTGGKELPSPFKSFAWLVVLLAMIGAGAVFMKRIRTGRSGARVTGKKGFQGIIEKVTRSAIGSGERLIEVVANHHLSPKQSIAVVKVAGKKLVLGITDESINLITRIQDGEEPGDTGEAEETSSAGAGTREGNPAGDLFSEILQGESNRPRPGKDGARERIRERLEGFKSL